LALSIAGFRSKLPVTPPNGRVVEIEVSIDDPISVILEKAGLGPRKDRLEAEEKLAEARVKLAAAEAEIARLDAEEEAENLISRKRSREGETAGVEGSSARRRI
jgi:hypothetical protein